jgi:hypothetical protein
MTKISSIDPLLEFDSIRLLAAAHSERAQAELQPQPGDSHPLRLFADRDRKHGLILGPGADLAQWIWTQEMAPEERDLFRKMEPFQAITLLAELARATCDLEPDDAGARRRRLFRAHWFAIGAATALPGERGPFADAVGLDSPKGSRLAAMSRAVSAFAQKIMRPLATPPWRAAVWAAVEQGYPDLTARGFFKDVKRVVPPVQNPTFGPISGHPAFADLFPEKDQSERPESHRWSTGARALLAAFDELRAEAPGGWALPALFAEREARFFNEVAPPRRELGASESPHSIAGDARSRRRL